MAITFGNFTENVSPPLDTDYLVGYGTAVSGGERRTTLAILKQAFYLNGVTSNIQTQLNAKQSAITGGASTVVSSNLTINKVLVSDVSGKITTSIVTDTELGYLTGATSNVQTQLNIISGVVSTIVSSSLTINKALVSDATGKIAASTVSDTELSYLTGVTSNVQTQLNAKQETITGGASTIASSNLTVNKVLVSDVSGKVHTSTVSDTELAYLTGLTSSVQTQLNTKMTASGNLNLDESLVIGLEFFNS